MSQNYVILYHYARNSSKIIKISEKFPIFSNQKLRFPHCLHKNANRPSGHDRRLHNATVPSNPFKYT